MLTAKPVEMAAVLAHLTGDRTTPMAGPLLCEIGHFTTSSGLTWRVVAVEVGPGNVDTAGAVVAVTAVLRPDVLIFVGIAGALTDDLNVGDVVAGTEVLWTERGKWTKGGYLSRARTVSLSTLLTQIASQVKREGRWLTRLAKPLPGAKALVGQIASGEKVVADLSYKAWLQEAFSDALAIENEGFALARAAEVYADGERYVVRGISDSAGPGKSDDGQADAAAAAAAFTFELLDAYSRVQDFGQLTDELVSQPASLRRTDRKLADAIRDEVISQASSAMAEDTAGFRSPEITQITFSGEPGSYRLTIEGRAFGAPARELPFYGTLPNFRIANSAQIGQGEWGYTGNRNRLNYESWTDDRIVVSGLGASPGDAIVLALWNNQTKIGVCRGENVPPNPALGPVIEEVIFSGPAANPAIIIRGRGFGSAPTTMPCTGALNYLLISDWRQHPEGTGPSGTWRGAVTQRFTSWSDDTILISGLAGAFGQRPNVILPGDPLSIQIWSTTHGYPASPQTAWGGRFKPPATLNG